MFVMCGSAHSCGCVVNGTFARAAFCIITIIEKYGHTKFRPNWSLCE